MRGRDMTDLDAAKSRRQSELAIQKQLRGKAHANGFNGKNGGHAKANGNGKRSGGGRTVGRGGRSITHVQAGSVFGPRRTPKPKAPPVVNPPPPPAAASGVTHLPMLNPNWQLWWLHPPKCATSFRYSVLDYPWSPMRDKSFPFGNHQVLFPDIAAARNENKAKLVGFFRQPEERLMSGYLHMNATPPCCTEDWGWRRQISRFVRSEFKRRPFVSGSNFLRGRFHGCMTNMLLAKGCMSEFAKTPADVHKAITIVKDFAFVGDVSQWNLSICLFNTIMTGRRFALEKQLANVKAGAPSVHSMHRRTEDEKAAAAKRMELADPKKLPEDPIDGLLYKYVRMRLERDLLHWGVRWECCPVYQDIQQVANASEVCH